MNKKLEQGAESFKQFVLDEYNQLAEANKQLGITNELVEKRYKDLQTKHQDLTALSLKLTNENERMSKKLTTIGNLTKIEMLEKQIHAFAASHADLINKNSRLRLEQENLINDNFKLRKSNKELTLSNTKNISINNELIVFLDSIGYKINKNIEALKPASVDDLKEFLKNMLDKKYHVEEVKPKPKSEEVLNIETLKDMLVKGLSKDFDVHVIGDIVDTNKKSSKRDSKGRYSN